MNLISEGAGQNLNRIAILTFKSPLSVQGGLDLRIMGIAKALSLSSEVHIIPIFGESKKEDIESNIKLTEGSGLVNPQNHEVLRWIKENPGDPYGILSIPETRKFVLEKLVNISPTHIIAQRLTCWRILRDIDLPGKCTEILDLDESARRLHESFSLKALNDVAWKFHAEFQRHVAIYEEKVLKDPSAFLVSSSIEAETVNSITNRPELTFCIENVVVDDRTHPDPAIELKTKKMSRILFPANFAYPPNRAALDEIVQKIAPALPNMEFRIVGSNLGVKTEWLNSNISFESPIISMDEEFKNSDFLIAPLRWGAGTRIKVLEAMKFGLPVIATKFAVEGLGLVPNIHYVPAESPEEFIMAINLLSNDIDFVKKLIINAEHLVRESFTVKMIHPKLKKALASGN